jgi:hypothetical protein
MPYVQDFLEMCYLLHLFTSRIRESLVYLYPYVINGFTRQLLCCEAPRFA